MALLDDYSEFETNVTPLKAEPADPVMAQWARFRDRFAEAMEGSLHSIGDLEQQVSQKRAFLFAGKDGAIVGRVKRYPTGALAMNLLWACGDLKEAARLLPGIEAVARMQGCVRVTASGRKALERVLADAGYGFEAITLQKAL